MGYLRKLGIFAAALIVVVFAAIFVVELFVEEGFTEQRAASLLRNHYQPISVDDFGSEVEDEAAVKQARYTFRGGSQLAGGVLVPSYLGFAEAIITYDEFGGVVSAHLTLVNETVPGFSPTRTWSCNGRDMQMLAGETEDYLALMFTGSMLVELVTENFLGEISESSPVLSPDTEIEISLPLMEAIEDTKAGTEMLFVWYYNPEHRQEYSLHVQNSLQEIADLGCV